MWLELGENRAPPLQIEVPDGLFKLAFWRLTLSTPKRCHMDLCLAQLFLTHHHHHRLQLLPFATLPGVRVSSSFLPVVFFSGGAAFCPCLVRPRVVVQLSLLSRYSVRAAFNSAHWPPIWLSRLLSHWSGSRTVPLTQVLRLLTSAELRLYRTSLPRMIVSRTIWSELTRLRWSPSGLIQDVPWAHSRNR